MDTKTLYTTYIFALSLLLASCESTKSNTHIKSASEQPSEVSAAPSPHMAEESTQAAQSPLSALPAPPGPNDPALSPPERAQVATQMLTRMLSLNEVQSRQVHKIFLTSAKETDRAFDELSASKRHAAFRRMQQQKVDSLRSILTVDQYMDYIRYRSELNPYMRFK
ncbi:hypothetical protein KS4_09120 [Poriferisphaera corsica]|uniref:Uncharacterized protein n=1 Tax=Poriferisphaera corsica TaxID=2528020 RepID=A0A517YRL3_9BACT|nr:hypothetical protein [Poriferisphaera corsica]QDU32873.1 hypothetical protein KS4_09120 [Poriferisphaera corsica]